MLLYRCITPTNRLCPCGEVARELTAQGIEFETRRVAFSAKPEKRGEIIELTGQPMVPVLVEDDGTATHESAQIIEGLRTGRIRARG
jgi:glutathione S-transferase